MKTNEKRAVGASELPTYITLSIESQWKHNRGHRGTTTRLALKEIGWWSPDPWCRDLTDSSGPSEVHRSGLGEGPSWILWKRKSTFENQRLRRYVLNLYCFIINWFNVNWVFMFRFFWMRKMLIKTAGSRRDERGTCCGHFSFIFYFLFSGQI